jgi:hypothetical protein
MDTDSNYMDKENGMNGWQRLWVVASLVIGLGFAFVGWQNIPTEEREAAEHFRVSTIALEFKLPSQYTVESDKREYERYEEFKDDLIYRQLEYIGTMLAIWAGVCAVLYAIGYGCGWVYRGFRPKTV